MRKLKKRLKPFRLKLTTEAEYDNAVKTLSTLLDREPMLNKEELEYLDLLGTLVEEYEQRTSPEVYADIDIPVAPIDAIRWAMDRNGFMQKDLCPYIGSESVVSAVLKGQRSLSKAMIVRLHEGLGIPYENLLPASCAKPHSSLRRVAAVL